MPQINFINNNGGGFAGSVTIPAGQTIEQFLVSQGITNFSDYNIRVNREEVVGSHTLQAGDRVSAVPRPGTVDSSSVLQNDSRVSVTPKRVAGALSWLIA